VYCRFRPEAEADLADAYRWYEDKRVGLGDEFLDTVDRVIAQVLAHPECGTPIHRTARRVLLDRFPYGVYYRVATDAIVIVACFHASRDPQHWRERL
jgi:toxin ParE1/3/4